MATTKLTPRVPRSHLSVRVPWHDAGWVGTVCRAPGQNSSCLALNRIGAAKRDEIEEPHAGQFLDSVPHDEAPPCFSERVSFLSARSQHRLARHAYARTSDDHRHIRDTLFLHPAFSAAATPFGWLLKDRAWGEKWKKGSIDSNALAERWGIDSHPEYEPDAPDWLHDRPWIQGHRSFGGAQQAVRDLAGRDWRATGKSPRTPPRTILGSPRLADGVALDRAVGCLLGQVAGDSLGSLVEFRSLLEIARQCPNGVRDLSDGGTWHTMAGQPTDDSELAISLARTLATQQSWSSEAVAAAYAGWYSSGPFDIGTTTRQALRAAAAAREDKAGAARSAANRASQSNGALMRCAPLGIWAQDAAEAVAAAREDAALTHPHPICQAASAALVAAIATAIDGGDRDMMLAAAEKAMPEADAAPLREALGRARRGENPDNFMQQQGWALIAFQNAFRHLAAGTSLEDALIETVGAGGDTDTNGAICGALLGAAQGRGRAPIRWSMAVAACRPLAETGACQPRPPQFWPDDLPLLAEALLARRMRTASRPSVFSPDDPRLQGQQ